ncbi:MAG: EAL domain-containing protein [Rhodocyclaceae bacterium]|nr:EAL domain-containing protein [Rhodocyclaceae bacterium]
MKLHRHLLLALAAILALTLLAYQAIAWHLAQQAAKEDLLAAAERIRSVLMSLRRVYQHAFLDADLPLNEKTLPLLPAFALNKIAEELKNFDSSGFSFNNVSDQARNHHNKADAEEMKAIAFFRDTPKADRYVADIIDGDGKKKLLYARPIWVEEYCLRCHGKPEEAPPSIRERYPNAYGYQVGDLRGVLSIKLPHEQIDAHAWRHFRWQALASLALFLIAGAVLGWRLRREIIQPLSSMAKASRRLAAGEPIPALAHSNIDEVAALTADFGEMAQKVRAASEMLAQSEARLRTTLASIGDAVIATDSAGCIDFMNPVAEALTGWRFEEARGRPVHEVFVIVNEVSNQALENPVARVLREGLVVGLANHTVLIRRDGLRTPIADAGAPIRDEKGQISGVVLVFRDVARERAAQKRLAESETRYRLIAENASDCITWRNEEGRFLYVSPAAQRIFGLSPETLLQDAAALDALIDPADRPLWQRHLHSDHTLRLRIEFKMRRADNELVWIEHECAPIYEQGRYRGRLGVFRDITARKLAEAEALRLAYHDALTNLPNRRELVERIDLALASARRNKAQAALILINLSGFKRLNEARGETFGNQTLIAVGERLSRLVREGDLVARTYGDEFALLLTGLEEAHEAATYQIQAILRKLQEALAKPFYIGGEDVTLAVCYGITRLPASADEDHEAVLRRAETALHRAKQLGPGQFAFFEERMGEAVRQRFEIENALRKALAQSELRLYLQSQVDGEGQVVGAECLVRWLHPQRGLISPAQFIPIAEESQLIEEIGAWVLSEACRLIRRLLDEGRPLRLSVNLSPRQFRRPGFVQWFADLVVAHGADPGLLTLEVTESLTIDDFVETVGRMHAIRAQGAHFSLDDFGTGYSSLAYLKRLPISEIKIDKSFILDAPQDADDAALVDTILAVARQLRLRVVAEGVETEQHAAFLDGRGEIIRQGYYYGRPQPLEDWLSRWDGGQG